MTLREKYGPLFKQLMSQSEAAAKIDETAVYQEANPKTKVFMDGLIEENIKEFKSKVKGKKIIEISAINGEGKEKLLQKIIYK